MKFINILILITFSPIFLHGQQLRIITDLQSLVKETSGLIYLDHKLITHNDSGGEPALYEIDSITGNVVHTVVVGNATNVDWEDICFDSTYIYIADCGNNDGSRKDLRIFRLPVSNYLMTDNDTVTVDTIHFSYHDQKEFTAAPFATNFDAEALISLNDSLYIFTKNWGNLWTNIYAIPKTPGIHKISKMDSLNVEGLVTGATYNPQSNSILLTGYSFASAFIIEISDYTNNGFSRGSINTYYLEPQPGSSIQIEGIASVNQNQYYLTAEESISGGSVLYGFKTANVLSLKSIDEVTSHIYPNPTSEMVQISYEDLSSVEIYDLQGNLRKASSSKQIYLRDLGKGIYIVIARNSNGDQVITRKLIIE